MDMRMKHQVLSPTVQDCEEADRGAQMIRVGRNFQQRVGGGAEQQVVEFDGVLMDQPMEFVRQGKDDMKITGRQKLLLPCGDPALAGLSLALGTSPVAA